MVSHCDKILRGGRLWKARKRIAYALRETEILLEPKELISTTKPTTLHYYVLTEPVYLEVFKNEGPETKIRQGDNFLGKTKIDDAGIPAGYAEGFSAAEAKGGFRIDGQSTSGSGWNPLVK